MQLELQVGAGISHDMIHLPVIRALTRQLPAIYPEIADETSSAFGTQFGKHGKPDKDGTPSLSHIDMCERTNASGIGWMSVKALNAFTSITAQLNARAFIGLPLCRDEKWKKAIEMGGGDLSWRAILLRLFPEQRRS